MAIGYPKIISSLLHYGWNFARLVIVIVHSLHSLVYANCFSPWTTYIISYHTIWDRILKEEASRFVLAQFSHPKCVSCLYNRHFPLSSGRERRVIAIVYIALILFRPSEQQLKVKFFISETRVFVSLPCFGRTFLPHI